MIVGSLRSYDGCCNENDTLKLTLRQVKCFTIIPYLSHYTKRARCTFVCLARMAVKAENENFIAAGLRCRQNLKYENFTSSFGILRQTLHQKACHTCSTIIFPRSANQVIDL